MAGLLRPVRRRRLLVCGSRGSSSVTRGECATSWRCYIDEGELSFSGPHSSLEEVESFSRASALGDMVYRFIGSITRYCVKKLSLSCALNQESAYVVILCSYISSTVSLLKEVWHLPDRCRLGRVSPSEQGNNIVILGEIGRDAASKGYSRQYWQSWFPFLCLFCRGRDGDLDRFRALAASRAAESVLMLTQRSRTPIHVLEDESNAAKLGEVMRLMWF